MVSRVAIVVGFIFAYIVYLALSKKGFMLGYGLNFLYSLVSHYWSSSELTMFTIAKILLVTAIITGAEYIAYKKTQSFMGYLVYIVLMIVGIIVVIALTKALFTFLGNPSMLFELKK